MPLFATHLPATNFLTNDAPVHMSSHSFHRLSDVSLTSPTSTMAWFGHAAVTVTAGPHQYLCVGAPFYKTPNTTNVVGAVYLYQLTTATTAPQATLVGTIVGTEHLAQFGHGLTLLHNNTLLAVSAPDAGSGSTGSTVCDCA